ncbi:hypothetical protein RGQ29_024747 [Quercus rubra]|uniref:Glycosyltransferase n=1 Tax=Quercus rubra TaxID=3512 RepID=A0AAN7EW42_QUERU|nr:hypothetical protein RGQ29_024747 [Quercus rubra]
MMKKVELVFVPAPGFSHLVPTIEFAKRLLHQDDRFSITILIMKHLLEPNSITYLPSTAATEPCIKLIDLPQADPPSPELSKYPETYFCTSIDNYKPHVKRVVAELVDQSLSNSSSVRIAGLVLDFFTAPMVEVGDEFGIPSYLFITANAAFLGLMFYLLARYDDRVDAELEDSGPEWAIPSFVNPVPIQVLPTPLFTKEDGYAATMKLVKRFRDVKGIIVNTFMEMESYALNSFLDGETPPVYPVGPVVSLKSGAHLSPNGVHYKHIMTWLDDQPASSVVFLSFGSMGSLSEPQVREIAFGLLNGNFRFLWSLRVPQQKEKEKGLGHNDNRNIEDFLPKGFLERTSGHGIICEWIPQGEVLAHKAIGGFVSHCGWNSILESLWFGVPIVTWPLFAEQQLNAFKLVKELGLAVEMKLEDRNSGDHLVLEDEVEKAIRCVMDGKSDVRRRVREMGESSRKAVIDGGSSFTYLGLLIEDMVGNI